MRVVVTAVGIASPLGLSAEAHFNAMLAGTRAIGPITQFDPSGFDCTVGAQVPDYRMADVVPKSYRKATKLMARDIELAMIAAHDAFTNAGLDSRATGQAAFNEHRFGCNIGAGLISADLDELAGAMDTARDGDRLDLAKWGSDGMQQLTPLWMLKYLPNMLACHVTIVHGLMGPSNTITCAEASGHLAIGEAFRTIQRGKADAAICGGAESMMNPMALQRQSLLNRLTRDGQTRPFSADSTGSVAGEGGGLMILESLDHAKARGATILCEIVGFGATQDAYSTTEPDPTGRQYGRAITNALKDAGATPDEVDLLVPHGLGIPSHDAAEMSGLKAALGDSLARPHVILPKTWHGNFAAGCAADACTTVQALHSGKTPPAPHAEAGGLNVSVRMREHQPRVGISSVYALGGHNAAVVFRRWEV